MIEDLRGTSDSELNSDICIVGAGAAGIALATELAGSDKRVLLLETGGDRFDVNADSLSSGESVGVPFSGLQAGRYRGLGGATRLWAGQCVPFDDIDVAARPWVPNSEWPISLSELAPFYRRGEKFFGLSGDEAYDERIWPRFKLGDPGFNHAVLRPRFTVYSPHPDLVRIYRRKLNAAANVRVGLYGHAMKLHLADGGRRIDRLEVGVPGRSTVVVRAGTYVLCNGGIESARLLLLSSDENTRGIGNEHDVVGRYYQDHPNGMIGTVETADPSVLQDLFALLYGSRKRYFPKLRLAPEVQVRKSTLNAVAHLVFEYEERGLEALRAYVRSARQRKLPARAVARALDLAKGSGQALAVFYRRYFKGRSPNFSPRRILLQAHVEQAPSWESRILLGDSIDAFGQRRARMDWRLGELEHRTFGAIADVVSEEFARLKLGSVLVDPWAREATGDWVSHVNDAYHQIGATRMSSDPKSGVVSPTLRVHSTSNLYICSSSVFPTSGYANPTLTIVALAMQLADLLRREARQ